ncbi:MAG: hypothetical protein J3R72DRAFT_455425 [Linnemannia gamsii]|nr:MAG: hypothetical protein J3R72DRAFT_455425 [Linnemannia gamsii]
MHPLDFMHRIFFLVVAFLDVAPFFPCPIFSLPFLSPALSFAFACLLLALTFPYPCCFLLVLSTGVVSGIISDVILLFGPSFSICFISFSNLFTYVKKPTYPAFCTIIHLVLPSSL